MTLSLFEQTLELTLSKNKNKKSIQRHRALQICRILLAIPLSSAENYEKKIFNNFCEKLTEFCTTTPVIKGLIDPGSDPNVLLIPIKIEA